GDLDAEVARVHARPRRLLHREVERGRGEVELRVAGPALGGRDAEGRLVEANRGVDVGDVERDVGLQDVHDGLRSWFVRGARAASAAGLAAALAAVFPEVVGEGLQRGVVGPVVDERAFAP